MVELKKYESCQARSEQNRIAFKWTATGRDIVHGAFVSVICMGGVLCHIHDALHIVLGELTVHSQIRKC